MHLNRQSHLPNRRETQPPPLHIDICIARVQIQQYCDRLTPQRSRTQNNPEVFEYLEKIFRYFYNILTSWLIWKDFTLHFVGGRQGLQFDFNNVHDTPPLLRNFALSQFSVFDFHISNKRIIHIHHISLSPCHFHMSY